MTQNLQNTWLKFSKHEPLCDKFGRYIQSKVNCKSLSKSQGKGRRKEVVSKASSKTPKFRFQGFLLSHLLSVVMQNPSKFNYLAALYESGKKHFSLGYLTRPQSSSCAWQKSEHGVLMSPCAPTSPRTPRAVWDYTKTAGDESVCLLKTYYLYGGLGLP